MAGLRRCEEGLVSQTNSTMLPMEDLRRGTRAGRRADEMACDGTGPLWRQLRDCAMLAINDAVRLGRCAEMPRLILHDGVNDGAF